MKAILDKKEGNKVSFNFEIDADIFEKEVQKIYLKNRGQFSLPGFRKGRVPRRMLEMHYGQGLFYEDALNSLLPDQYTEAVEQLELEPVAMPDVDVDQIEKGQAIKVKIEVEVKPEVELGDYKNIELDDIKFEYTDEMLENELKRLQEENARLIDGNDRPAENGDLLTIDFEGSVDGELFPGGSAENHGLEIGSNSFIPGFEEQLIGKSKDEEVEVKVTFPEDYHEESLAGKEAVFMVKIHDIKIKELPQLDDELALDVSEFDTLDELKASIKERLEKELADEERATKESAVVEKLIEISQVDIPEAMIENQVDDEIRQYDFNLRNAGLELEQYLQMTGMGIDDLREQLKPEASKRVNGDLVLEAVAEAEEIDIEDGELDRELEKMAEIYKAEDVEGFVEDMKKGDLNVLKDSIKKNKTIEFLLENVKFN